MTCSSVPVNRFLVISVVFVRSRKQRSGMGYSDGSSGYGVYQCRNARRETAPAHPPSRSHQQSTSGCCDQSNRCRGTILGSLSSSFPAAVVPVNNRLTGQTTPRETVCPLPYPASAIIIVKSCLPGHVRPESSPPSTPRFFAEFCSIPSVLSSIAETRFPRRRSIEDFEFVGGSLVDRSS